ncbi:MAG: hypothetical protein AAGD35_05630 [Actinomycetota bacterium]
METFANNWPVILVALAVVLIVLGLLQRVVKLAFFGAIVGVLALFLWPIVASQT